MTSAAPSFASLHDSAPSPVTTGRMIERLGFSSVLAPARVSIAVSSSSLRRNTFVPRRRDRMLMWGATGACVLNAALFVAGFALVR